MKNILNILRLIILVTIVTACSDDKIDKDTSVINIDKQGGESKFDEYLYEIYTKPYNIEFLYKWKDIESDMNYTTVPPKFSNAIKMANLVKYLCLDAYETVAPKGFLEQYFPKMIMLVGSSAYKNNGTRILGTAEGGLKIILFDINNLDTNDVDKLFIYYFQTIFHEFSHIMHQTTDYTTDFDRISAVDYKGDSWSSTWENEKEALKKGFISQYSSKEPNEDFVELIAYYVTNTEESWNKMLEPAGDEGRSIINQKMSIVKTYMLDVWQINLDKLRAEVMERADKLNNQDLNKITF